MDDVDAVARHATGDELVTEWRADSENALGRAQRPAVEFVVEPCLQSRRSVAVMERDPGGHAAEFGQTAQKVRFYRVRLNDVGLHACGNRSKCPKHRWIPGASFVNGL